MKLLVVFALVLGFGPSIAISSVDYEWRTCGTVRWLKTRDTISNGVAGQSKKLDQTNLIVMIDVLDGGPGGEVNTYRTANIAEMSVVQSAANSGKLVCFDVNRAGPFQGNPGLPLEVEEIYLEVVAQ